MLKVPCTGTGFVVCWDVVFRVSYGTAITGMVLLSRGYIQYWQMLMYACITYLYIHMLVLVLSSGRVPGSVMLILYIVTA
jgi:hypothetical protein